MSEKYKVDPAHLNYNISTRIDYDIANKTASMQILLGKLLWQPQNKDFLRHFSAKARYIMQDAFKLVKTAGQATNFGADRPFPSDAEKAELEGILKKRAYVHYYSGRN